VPAPPDRRWWPARLIEDRYLTGTRLRLRRVSPLDGGPIEHKLGQKVRPDPGQPGLVLHTTMYLDPGEHARLGALPGADLRKVRHAVEFAGRRFSMDVFQGRHAGLVLLEIEVPHGEEVVPPPFAGPEVTGDERYAGGWLAAASPEALRSLM
jgi:hypothetical protein